MNTILLISLAFGFVLAVPSDKYTTKYDGIDIQEVIRSDRVMRLYVHCLLDKATCTPDGRELKNLIGDALETDCAKCSETQKKAARVVIRHLLKNKRGWWDDLEEKYDPERKYIRKYQDEIKAEGIVL